MERNDLLQMQKTPLFIKEMMSFDRVRELMRFVGYDSDRIYVSFSGGKDSEVLVDLMARSLSRLGYKTMHVLYVNTGLEYSSVREFIKPFIAQCEKRHQIDIILDVRTPQISFKEVLKKSGYPIISKETADVIDSARRGYSDLEKGTYLRARQKIEGRLTDKEGNKSQYNCEKYAFLLDAPFKISKHCCPVTKQQPAKLYEKETGRIPVLGTLAEESANRQSKWIRQGGCNAFSCERPTSSPLSFWTENDILTYIVQYNLGIAKPYGKIKEKDISDSGKFKGQMKLFSFEKKSDEKYTSIPYSLTAADRTGCCYCLFGIQFDPERILRMQKLEPKKADFVLRGGEFDENGNWGPSEEGLGFWYVLDFLNSHGIPVPYNGTYRQDWATKIAA